MTDRKNPKLDLRNYKGLFFNIGLVAALSLVLMAFEWKTVEPTSCVFLDDFSEDGVQIIEPPMTVLNPPPPKVVNPVIIEKPDDIKIDDIGEVVIDVQPTEDQPSEPVFEPMPDEEAEVIHIIVEEQPKFRNGGQEEFLRYVSSKLKYPALARKMGIEGKVFVQFIVDKEGNMTDIEVVKGLGAGCDEEVLRVLKSTTGWTPGKQRGQPVKVRMMIPVAFKLN